MAEVPSNLPWPEAFFFNTLRPRQNGRHFSKCIFLNENVWIVIKISMKFVLKSPINNIPALVQMMAWHRPGNKPLSESMMISSMTYVRVTQKPCQLKLTIFKVCHFPKVITISPSNHFYKQSSNIHHHTLYHKTDWKPYIQTIISQSVFEISNKGVLLLDYHFLGHPLKTAICHQNSFAIIVIIIIIWMA